MAYIEFSSKVTNPEVPEVADISAEEVHEKQGQVKLVDVRKPDEYTGELGHVKNAELMTLDTLESRVNELPKDQSIVFICRSGKRSITASVIAQNAGFESCFNMVGGMIRWNELGFDIEK